MRGRLKDGTPRLYYYAWRGGPRLPGAPGSPEFVAAFQRAHDERKKAPPGTVAELVTLFKSSTEFRRRAESTRREYLRYLRQIEIRFGRMEILALEAPAVRGVFKAWRDEMAGTPRQADLAWATLARVLSVAKDRGRIRVNPCERGGRLYRAERRDAVWTDDHIARFEAVAPPPLQFALLAALWTGQRQGDLLRLTWDDYDGTTIRLRQSKTGVRLSVPAGQPLRRAFEEERTRRPPAAPSEILLNSHGQPWTSSGFQTAWQRASRAAGIRDVTFHDLRGSAATRLAIAGCTVPEIAAITGHSLADVSAVLDRHYLGKNAELARQAVRKLERRSKRKSVK